MSVSYDPLWKTLIDMKVKRYELIKLANISANVIAKMGKNEYVSLQSIERVCAALGCRIEDVVEIIDGEVADD